MVKRKTSKRRGEERKSINERRAIQNLAGLAHQGKVEEINKIVSENKNLGEVGAIARDEALMFRYEPKNDSEERDLLLMWLIRRKENQINDWQVKLDSLEGEALKERIEDEVHANVMAATKNKDWEYYAHSFFSDIEKRKSEFQNDIDYAENWNVAARKMVKNKKYLDLPADYFDHMHYDWEGEAELDGDECEFCPDCGGPLEPIDD